VEENNIQALLDILRIMGFLFELISIPYDWSGSTNIYYVCKNIDFYNPIMIKNEETVAKELAKVISNNLHIKFSTPIPEPLVTEVVRKRLCNEAG